MSNARYFAGGVDFWRVLYPNGSTDGPYISPVSARKVGNAEIKVQQRWSYAARKEDRVLLREWQNQPSYRLQKLSVAYDTEGYAELAWTDVDA